MVARAVLSLHVLCKQAYRFMYRNACYVAQEISHCGKRT